MGALLNVIDESEHQHESSALLATNSSSSSSSLDEVVDHFPFREAIPAPTAVTRISQITADIAESAEALRIAAEHAAVLQTGNIKSYVLFDFDRRNAFFSVQVEPRLRSVP